MVRVSSQDELIAVVRCAEGFAERRHVIELCKMLEGAEARGFASERKRCDVVSNGVVHRVRGSDRYLPASAIDHAGMVFVFRSGCVWAAVEVGADGRTLTLLKVYGAFSGNAKEEADLLADALDRQNRGERI